MTGLDTNVLVRYLTLDDPVQSSRARKTIEHLLNEGETFFLNTVVLCELVWVLEGAYNFAKKDIADVLEKILLTAQFNVSHRDEVWQALTQYRRRRCDFSDALIGRINRGAGCKKTLSFDKDALKLEDFSGL